MGQVAPSLDIGGKTSKIVHDILVASLGSDHVKGLLEELGLLGVAQSKHGSNLLRRGLGVVVSVESGLVSLGATILDPNGKDGLLQVGGDLGVVTLVLDEMVETAAQLVDNLGLLGIAGLGDGELAQELNVPRVGVVELVAEPVNDGSEEALQ